MQASGIVDSVLRGEYEILGSEDYQRGLWRNEINTYTVTGLCAVMRRQSISVAEHLFKVIPWKVQLQLFAVFALIILVFARLLKLPYSNVTMNALLVCVGNGPRFQPKNKWQGLLLLHFLLPFLIINAFVQSKLSALLLVVSEADVVTDLTELFSGGYIVSLSDASREIYSRLTDSEYSYVNMQLLTCLSLMKNASNFVCIDDCTFIRYVISENDEVQIKQVKYFGVYDVLLMRDYSPLHETVKIVYDRLLAHGFIEYIQRMDALNYKRPSQNLFSDLSIHNLRFAFYFVAIAYLSGALLFFAEISVHELGFRFRK